MSPLTTQAQTADQTLTRPLASDYVNQSNESSFTVTGTAKTTDTITVSVYDMTKRETVIGETGVTNSSGNYTTTLDLSGQDDGRLIITVWFSKVVLDRKESVSRSVIVEKDTVSPTIVPTVTPTTATATVTEAKWRGVRYAFTSTATCDNTVIVSETAGTRYKASIPLTRATHNEKYFCVRAEDEAGNVAYGLSSQISIPVAPAKPSAVTLTTPSSSPSTDTTPTFTVTVGQTGGTVTLYSDNGCTTALSSATPVTDTISPYTVVIQTETLQTSKTYTVYANHTKDGVPSACSTVTATYALDTTAPTVNPATSQSQATAGVTDTNKKNDGIRYTFADTATCDNTVIADNTAGTAYTAPVSLTRSTHNGKYFCVRAEDELGNVAYGVSGRIALQPITIISPLESTSINRSNYWRIVVSGRAEPAASIYLSVDDEQDTSTTPVTATTTANANGRWSVTVNLSSLNDGTLEFAVRGTVGQVADSNTIELTKDTTAPTVTVAVTTSKATATVTGAKTNGVRYTFTTHTTCDNTVIANNSSGTAYTEAITLTSAHKGKYFCVRAEDELGYVAYGVSGQISIAERSIVIPPSNSYVNQFNEHSFFISGTAKVSDSFVAISTQDSGSNASDHDGTPRVDSNGKWSANLNLSSLDQGELTVTVKFGSGGNNAPTKTITLIKDIVAPVITTSITTIPGAKKSQSDWDTVGKATVTVNGGGDRDRVWTRYAFRTDNRCDETIIATYWDSAPYIDNAPVPLNKWQHHGRHFCVRAEDEAGNVSYSVSSRIDLVSASSQAVIENLTPRGNATREITSIPSHYLSGGNDGFLRHISTYAKGNKRYAVVAGNFGFALLDITDPNNIIIHETNPSGQHTVPDSANDRDGNYNVYLGETPISSAPYTDSSNGKVYVFGAYRDARTNHPNISVQRFRTDAGASGDKLDTNIGTHALSDRTNLNTAQSVATYSIGGKDYAVVVTLKNPTKGKVVILEMSDETAKPIVRGVISENSAVESVATYSIGNKRYAVVASTSPGGMRIFDVTDPTNPTRLGGLAGGDEAYWPLGVATYSIGDKHYAIVLNDVDTHATRKGMQIVDVTDPNNPIAKGGFQNNANVSFASPRSAATLSIGDRYYALVTAKGSDNNPNDGAGGNALHILDITDPDNITHLHQYVDNAGVKIRRPSGVATYSIGDKHYAIVTSAQEGVQIFEIEHQFIAEEPSQTLTITAPTPPSRVVWVTPSRSPSTDTTPTFRVTVGETGGDVTLYSDRSCRTALSSATTVADTTSPYTVVIQTETLQTSKTYTVYAKHTKDGVSSDCSTASARYTLDTVAPTIAFKKLREYGGRVGATEAIVTGAKTGGVRYKFITGTTTPTCDSTVIADNTAGTAYTVPIEHHYSHRNKYLCVRAEDELGNVAHDVSTKVEFLSTSIISPSFSVLPIINSFNVRSFPIKGRSKPGNTMTVTVQDEGQDPSRTVRGTATVGTDGLWSVTLDLSSLNDDTPGKGETEIHAYTTIGQNVNGQRIKVGKDTTPPTVTASAPLQTAIATVSGAKPGGVRYTFTTHTTCDNTVIANNSSGTAYIRPIWLNRADHYNRYFCVRAEDVAGNVAYGVSEQIDFVSAAPSAITLTTPSSSPGKDTTPTFTVTVGQTGGTVTLYSDNSCQTALSSATSVTDTTGTITVDVTVSPALTTEKTYTVYAKHTKDGVSPACSSATATYTLDTTAPAKPTVDLAAASDSGSSTTDNKTSDTTPTITVGNLTSGDSVTVTATKNGATNVTTTGTASGSTLALTLGTLSDGEWSITATSTDPAGNSSAASSALTVTIDTTSPTIQTTNTKYYSNSGLTTVIADGAKKVTNDTIYTKVVFSENVVNINANDETASPYLFYSIGSTGTQYEIVAHNATLAHGKCKAKSSTDTSEYKCMYTVPSDTSGIFKFGVIAIKDIVGNTLASQYDHADTLILNISQIPVPAAPTIVSLVRSDNDIYNSLSGMKVTFPSGATPGSTSTLTIFSYTPTSGSCATPTGKNTGWTSHGTDTGAISTGNDSNYTPSTRLWIIDGLREPSQDGNYCYTAQYDIDGVGNNIPSAYATPEKFFFDGTSPTVTVADTGYYSNANLAPASELTANSHRKEGQSIYTKVKFSENVEHASSGQLSIGTPPLFYVIGSTETKYDIVAHTATLAHGKCKAKSSTNTSEYKCMYTVPANTNGTFRIRVKNVDSDGGDTIDLAGNTLAATYNHATTLTIDTTAPTVTASAPLRTATATVIGAKTGGVRYRFITDNVCNSSDIASNSAGTAYSSSIPLTFAAHNNKYFCVRAEDEAGNVAYGRSSQISIPQQQKQVPQQPKGQQQQAPPQQAPEEDTQQPKPQVIVIQQPEEDTEEQQQVATPTVPGQVVNVLEVSTPSSVTVSWDAPETGSAVEKYTVRLVSLNNKKKNLIKKGGAIIVDTTQTQRYTHTFEGLESGREYQIRIIPRNSAGKGKRALVSVKLPFAE